MGYGKDRWYVPTFQHSVDAAVDCIRSGGVLVYPTETVYGIGGDPFKKSVVERIRVVKGRARGKGFLLLIPDVNALEGLVREIPETAQRLIERFWPGPLTLIFMVAPHLSTWLTDEGETIALRMSSDPIAHAIVEAWKGPLISTSANQSGRPPALSIDELDPAIARMVDLVINGGHRGDTHPSTIVDVSCREARIIRVGQIPSEEIERVVERRSPRRIQRTEDEETGLWTKNYVTCSHAQRSGMRLMR